MTPDSYQWLIRLNEWRKAHIKHYEWSIGQQKQCAKEKDFNNARWFSNEGAESLKNTKQVENWIYEFIDQPRSFPLSCLEELI